MRKLGRIGILGATIKKFLKALKRKHAELFTTHIETDFAGRYLDEQSEGCFSRVKPSESSKTLQKLGEDLLYLIELFSSHARVKELPEYGLLERVLHEQCRVTDKKVTIKTPKEIESNSLQNPSDTDAGYDSHKGQGYKVQIMETYTKEKQDDTKPALITYVDVEPAHEHDANALQPALEDTLERDCCPEKLLCDTLYGGDENIQKASFKGVEVIAPVKGPAPSSDIGLNDFKIDPNTGFILRCPEGHEPEKVATTRTERKSARFNKEQCIACPLHTSCPVTIKKKAAFLYYTNKTVRLARRRAYEQTKEFKDEYRWRAGIEAINSHLKIDLGAARLKVRGLANVRFAVMLKALGLNILRCANAHAACFCSYLTRILSLFNCKTSFGKGNHSFINIYLSKNICVYTIAA